MRILFFILCIVMLPINTIAQTIIKDMNGANTRFIPGNYMKNGEAAIYFSDNEYGYSHGVSSYEAEIFDFELNPLKSFDFQIIRPYTETEQRASSGTKEIIKTLSPTKGKLYGMPPVSDMDARKDAFITWFYNENRYADATLTINGLAEACRIEGTTIYIPLPIRDYYNYPYQEFLKAIDISFDSDDTYAYNYTYATQVPVYDGEWTKTICYDTPISNFCTPKCTDVAGMNHWNGGVYLPFSQTFFNDDDKFEYVRYKTEIVEGYGVYGDDYPIFSQSNALEELFGITANDRDGDGKEDSRSTHFGVKHTGFEVVTEDGTIIYTFDLPNCEDKPSIEFFKSDNSILVQVGFSWRDNDNNYRYTDRFYRVDKSAGINEVLREENRMSVAPNPVSVGSPVKMIIPQGTDNNRIVSVTSLNGIMVFNKQIERDVTSLSIPTQNLSAGIYLFTLTENGRIIGNSKIIVR